MNPPKPSDLKSVGAWRRTPVKVAGITVIPAVANEVDRERVDARLFSTVHDKENTDNDRTD